MVNSRLCKTASLAFFSASLRLFEFLDCETEMETTEWLCENIEAVRHAEPLKKRDCKTCEIQLKNLQDPYFLKDHCSTPNSVHCVCTFVVLAVRRICW